MAEKKISFANTIKAYWRTQMDSRRVSLTEGIKKLASQRIVERLLSCPTLSQSQSIAAYLAINGEIDLAFLFEALWQQEKDCYLPIVVDKTLVFSRYLPDTPLTPNRWGILEPPMKMLIAPYTLDIVLTPLVAFDTLGNRLGRGGGYYDRSFTLLRKTLPPHQPKLIGVAYDWQKTDPLPVSPWDISLHAVVTDVSYYETAPILQGIP